jgi:hypothetical protein
MNTAGKRTLVVSLHDVTPAFRPAGADLLRRLRDAGVPRTVLLVVPRWHGGEPFSRDPAFCGWLRDLQAQGHEIALHGYIHRDEQPRAGSPWRRWVATVYTASEGEFLSLDRAAAERRIREGLDVFREAGLSPRGFVAPAWLMSPGAVQAAAALGFSYTTTWSSILPLPAGLPLRAPVLVASTRAAWRRAASRAWLRLWGALQGRADVLRVAFHPADLRHPAVADLLLDVSRRAARGREVVTYAEIAARMAQRS